MVNQLVHTHPGLIGSAMSLPVHLRTAGLLLAFCGGSLVRKDKDDVSLVIPEFPPKYYHFLTTGRNAVLLNILATKSVLLNTVVFHADI